MSALIGLDHARGVGGGSASLADVAPAEAADLRPAADQLGAMRAPFAPVPEHPAIQGGAIRRDHEDVHDRDDKQRRAIDEPRPKVASLGVCDQPDNYAEHDPENDQLHALPSNGARQGSAAPSHAPSDRFATLRVRLTQVAQEEADASQVSVDDVLGVSPKRAATAARIRTVVRMLAEPQCNKSTLARAWGCERRTIQRLAARAHR